MNYNLGRKQKMKKILIVFDEVSNGANSIENYFFSRLKEISQESNSYFIITKNRISKDYISNKKLKFFNIDTTSQLKLQKILTNDFYLSILIINNQENLKETVKNIRNISEHIPIAYLDYWGISEIKDKDLDFKDLVPLNQNAVLANYFINELPNIPVMAQNIGLKKGEIIEAIVPFGSQYVFRRIGSIEQKNWHISAIYRNNKLILPTMNETIQTNDLLVLIGEPKLLQSVYDSIQVESKQFPKSFGDNIMILFDMLHENNELLISYIRSAIEIQKKIKNSTLFVKIINPTNILFLRAVKSYNSENIKIYVDYSNNLDTQDLQLFVKKNSIGLNIISHDLFKLQKFRKIFYELKKPLIKFSQINHEISNFKNLYFLFYDTKLLEQIAINIFDFAKQFNLKLTALKGADENINEALEDQLNTLSKILGKEIIFEHYSNVENPIRLLKTKENILTVMPFSSKILESQIKNFFSKDLNRMFFYLEKQSQILLPINL
jgi:hypothetical protein